MSLLPLSASAESQAELNRLCILSEFWSPIDRSPLRIGVGLAKTVRTYIFTVHLRYSSREV